MRDKSRAGGVFLLKVDKDKVLDEIKGYNLFTINVSSTNFNNIINRHFNEYFIAHRDIDLKDITLQKEEDQNIK